MKILYQGSVGYLASVCRRYIRDDDDVKDLLQESYLKIFDKIGRFKYMGEGSLIAWMKKIVINDALKTLSPKKKAFSLEALGKRDDGDDIPDEVSDPPLESVPIEELLRMIRSLPDGYRTVFNLFVFEEKSHKEIASFLGIKENSSASQLFHAKAMLAKLVKDYYKTRSDGYKMG